MLRESATAYGYDFDVAVIADTSTTVGIPGGNHLLLLVDILHGESDADLSDVHISIINQLGSEALVDAAAVFGNFQMMNRVAEASGVAIARQAMRRESEIVTKLDLLRILKH